MSLTTTLRTLLILAVFDGDNLGFGGAYAGTGNIVSVVLVVVPVRGV